MRASAQSKSRVTVVSHPTRAKEELLAIMRLHRHRELPGASTCDPRPFAQAGIRAFSRRPTKATALSTAATAYFRFSRTGFSTKCQDSAAQMKATVSEATIFAHQIRRSGKRKA